MSAATAIRWPHAFSVKTQRRFLSMLRRRAIGGDVEAAETLLRLAREAAGDRAATVTPRSAAD
jgi:hypothetical protein